MEGQILDPPTGVTEANAAAAEAAAELEGEEAPEVPSVMSVVNRYLIGGADVSPPQEDGSRALVLQSTNGQAVIEASLSPQLCEYLSGKLVEIEVIEQGDDNAGSGE